MADPRESDGHTPGPQQFGPGADLSPLTLAVTALSDLASHEPAHAPPRADAESDALSVIGSALHHPLRPVVLDVDARMAPRDAAAVASGWFAWRVRLPRRWWKRATLPMLVDTDQGPGAVLPDDGGAVAVAANTRTVTRLDRRHARGFDDTATAYAEDLPEDARWWSIVRWSISRQRHGVLIFLALAVLGGISGLLLPVATAAIFEYAIPYADLDRVWVILGAFTFGSIGAVVVTYTRGVEIVRLRDQMDSVLAPGVMARVLRLPATFFRRHPIGDVVNRALSVQAARKQVMDTSVALVITSAFGLASIGYIFTAGWGIGLVTVLTVVALLVAAVGVQFKARRLLPALLDGRARSDTMFLSLLNSLVVWRSLGSEDRAMLRWSREQQLSTRAMRARLGAISLASPLEVAGPVIVLIAFTVAVVLMPGTSLQPGSSEAPGVFMAMYAAILQVTIALLALSGNLVTLSEYGPVLSRLRPILDSPPERSGTASQPGNLKGGVALAAVTFGYRHGSTPLFRELSMTIEPGTFTAIVGPSGCGKSTLLRLLLGFETPWEGSVEFDGHDLLTLDPTAVRRQLGVVLQSGMPMGDTIRECIAGPLLLTDDDVWQALASSGLDTDVAALPAGLDTEVGPLGMWLSGGQRQRLLLAAALVKKPRILLFDEATSALDNITQNVVMETILASSATRIVVAHRLSTVSRADRIVVISEGEIAEDGTPEDLLRAGGLFATLAARQEL